MPRGPSSARSASRSTPTASPVASSPTASGPHQYRNEAGKQRGYSVAGLTDDDGNVTVGGLGDAWQRYLQPLGQESGTTGTAGTEEHPGSSEQLPLVPAESARTGTAAASGTDNGALTSDVPAVPDVPPPPETATASAVQLLTTEVGARPAGCPDCQPGRVSAQLLTGADGLQRCRRHHFENGRRP